MAIKKKVLKKKLSKKTAGKGPSKAIMDSANEIWLAGLGAFAMAQKESAKASAKAISAGSQLFDSLVKEGGKVDHKTRVAAANAVDDIKDSVEDIRDSLESRVSGARKQAVQNWDRMENVFEERVSRVLDRLGVPTSDDLKAFADKVQELAEKVKTVTEQEFSKVTRLARKDASTIAADAKKVTRTVKRTVKKDANLAAKNLKKATRTVKRVAKKDAKIVKTETKKQAALLNVLLIKM